MELFQPLLDLLLYLMVDGDVSAQKPKDGDRIQPFSLYNKRGMNLSVPYEVYYEFFCFKDHQLQVTEAKQNTCV